MTKKNAEEMEQCHMGEGNFVITVQRWRFPRERSTQSYDRRLMR